MGREWTEATARNLCAVTGALLVLCGAVIVGRVGVYKNLWRAPDLGVWANIILWICLAAGILFAMDRGLPREEKWAARLYWMRRALLVAIFATIGVLVYLK